MAGSIYYSDVYADQKDRYPDYFDGKLIIYEWMRNWFFIVHQDEAGNFIQADPFMPSTEFSHPMDMLFSKDGKFYILEYGQNYIVF